MIYETVNGVTLPKIGFGTWKIGGGGSPDLSIDDQSKRALRSALDLGYTHFDTAEYYGGGHAEELLGQAVRNSGIPRENLFITTKVSPEHLGTENLRRSCEKSLHRLGMEYLDLYLIHWPSHIIRLEETFGALNRLVTEGKIHHLGVSNFNLKLLQQAAALSETKLLTDQVPYSLPERTYARNGVLSYCQENDILLTAYSPVKRRFITGNKDLKELAKGKGVTTYQIALAWLVRQPRVITIPMSFDPAHQKDNLAAADIDLTEAELAPFG
jgi:diketogulonate reductase-like aldo/keto reductase